MPPEDVWQTFFNPTETLLALGLSSEMKNIVDFGCGYGTFTIPAARITGGTVHAFDIEADMLATVREKAGQLGLASIRLYHSDFVADGTGLPHP